MKRARARTPTQSDRSSGIRPSRGLLLVAEDHPDTLNLYSEYFSANGYDVLKAVNGQEAVGMVERNPGIDVVVMDVMMSGSGGVQALKRIMERQPSPRVIIVSGLNDSEVAAHARDLGAHDYLIKPVELEQLDAAVARCLPDKG